MQAKTSCERKGDICPSSCVYTSCYCEENVWKLCEKIRNEDIHDLKEYSVVFVSNNHRKVPFWMQKSATEPLSPVVWDYHVLLLRKTTETSLVYDLDSILAFPCPFQQYIQQAIQSERQLKKQFHRRFRVIPAQTFLQTFASDRSHMKKTNGEWLKTPPDYPPIRTADCTMNLADFIDMTPGSGEGEVLNQENFVERFTEFS